MLRAGASAASRGAGSSPSDRVRFSSPLSGGSASSGGSNNSKTPWGRGGRRRRWLGERAGIVLRRWGQQLRMVLIGDLPVSLSLRTKVRITLEARPLGHIWMVYQILLTLTSSAYLAISAAYRKEAAGLFIEETIFGASVLVDLLLRFYASDHRRWYFLERQPLIDVVTLIPILIDIAYMATTGSLPRVTADGPMFLRMVQGFKIMRILRVFNVGRQFSSPVMRQTIILVFAVVSILYMAASLVNLSEGIPFGSAVYFSVVTLATVGYGDITVASTLGRFWVCCLICISFIWLPYEINRLTQMLGLRSRFLTAFTPRADKPNVLLVGHLEPAKLSTFLTEFFHPDRRTDVNQAAFYHVVILDNEEPSDELVEVLEAPLIEDRVTFIKGTIMDEEALERAGAKSAVAAFIFSDGLAPDTEAADALTVLRVLVLKTFRPVLPCYVQLHHTHNRIQLHMLKRQRLVCIEDLKMSIMGLSALYPGFTTLLTNLLKSSVDHVADERMPQWQREYIEGSQLEVYMVRLPDAFHGASFHQARPHVATEAYSQLDGTILLLGVEERALRLDDNNGNIDLRTSLAPHKQHSNKYAVRQVLINPGRGYRMVVQPPLLETWAYVLAGNRHLAERIGEVELTPEPGPKQPHQAVDVPPAMWKEEEDDEGNEPAPTYDEEEGIPPAVAQQQPATIPERTTDAGGMRRFLSTLSSVSASGNNTANTATNRVSWHQHQHKHQQRPLPASASADVDGSGDSYEAAARGHSLSSFPSFHTTQVLPSEGAGITVVEDVRALGHVENHILVLLPKAVDKIQYLLRPLRAQFLKGTPFCKSVVFLTEAGVGALERHCRSLEPATDTSRAYDPIAALPFDIYLVEGQPHKAGDLRRAGIETAYTCVILADRASVQEIDEEAVDEAMIHQFVTIEKLRARSQGTQTRPPLNYVVEVLSLATLKILDQTYKTFKGTAIRKKQKQKQRHHHPGRGGRSATAATAAGGTSSSSTHFGADLRGRFTVFSLRSASPFRGASPMEPPQQQPSSPQAPQESPQRPPSLALHVTTNISSSTDAPTTATTAATPVSSGGDRTGGGSAALLTNGVDFGVSHAAMYPFVTAGASFLIDVFDIITCQLFYNSDLIRFVDLLLALDHAPDPSTRAAHSGGGAGTPTTVSASGATTIKVNHWSDLRKKGAEEDGNEGIASGRLGRVPVPLSCVGKTVGHLFATLMAEHEAMPLALYRHDARADVYYVFTGPPPTTVLRPTDFVFVLAPVERLRRVLAQYGGS